jgi:sporulation protein YlmC with PRC-barrel domain
MFYSAGLKLSINKNIISKLALSYYTTDVNKKKTLNKSFLLDFGYVESVGSVLLLLKVY